MIDFFKCVIFGCVKQGKRLAQVFEPTLPRGFRFVMCCPRCGGYDPMKKSEFEKLRRIQQVHGERR